MRAQILFLACVAILGCQAAPQPKIDEIDIDQIIQAITDFLENADIEELLNRIPDEETRQRVDEAIESLKKLAANIEDHRETIDCLQEVVDKAGYTLVDDIRLIVTEGIGLARLLAERNEAIAACEAIGGDNPSVLDLTRIRICLAGVEATTGVQIALSTFRIRQSANRLLALEDDVRVCVDHLIPE